MPTETYKSKVLAAYAECEVMDGLVDFLTRAGYSVERAMNGEEASEKATQAVYEIILMDNCLGEPAIDITRRLKDNPLTMYIPIVLISKDLSHGDRVAALDAGVDDILDSPVDPYEIVARLRSFRRICVRAREILRKEEMIDAHNRLLRSIIGNYVSPEIADELIRNPEKLSGLGGEVKTVTAMFADIRNFTVFAASHPPDEVVSLVNEVFEEMTEIIFRYKGTLDNFMGDCIMAFWGAPQPIKDHALMAICCANEMQAQMARIRDKWEKDEYYRLGLGIGVNTGEVIVGNVGHSRFKKYTIIGADVNIAARLENNARRNAILLSDKTYELVKEHIITEPVTLDMKGYQGKFGAHNLLKIKHPVILEDAPTGA